MPSSNNVITIQWNEMSALWSWPIYIFIGSVSVRRARVMLWSHTPQWHTTFTFHLCYMSGEGQQWRCGWHRLHQGTHREGNMVQCLLELLLARLISLSLTFEWATQIALPCNTSLSPEGRNIATLVNGTNAPPLLYVRGNLPQEYILL